MIQHLDTGSRAWHAGARVLIQGYAAELWIDTFLCSQASRMWLLKVMCATGSVAGFVGSLCELSATALDSYDDAHLARSQ